MIETGEKTALGASVGADAEQPFENNFKHSIPDETAGFNGNYADAGALNSEKGITSAPVEESPEAGRSVVKEDIPISFGDEQEEEISEEEIWRRLQRSMDPRFLHTVTMSELYGQIYQSRPPVIDGFLYPGTYLFVGSPKLGKSFLMAQIAWHVSTGTDLWNYPVRKGTVLYLALEDGYSRLQERLYRMFGTECSDHLYLTVSAGQLGNGLDEQLQNFVKEHPDTSLIIVDTLQKIREVGDDRYSYASDYEVITRLKQFTDSNGICLLLVHHTRKQQADDRFEMISGTNGLLGAADGAFLLHKDKRTSCEAVLDVSGRDQPDQTFYLNRNEDSLVWELDKAETERRTEKPEPVLEAVAKLLTKESPEWNGRATELVKAIGLGLPANTLSMKLNINAARLLNEYGIRYESSRNHSGRLLHFRLDTEQA